MRVALTFSLVLSAVVLLSVAHDAQAQTPAATAQAQAPAEAITYKPPLRGAPARRVGGATRGSGDADLVLNVLAPDQTGHTTQAQPRLYWYASKPSAASIEVTVISDKAEQPVLTKSLTTLPGGMHFIDLADHGITLSPDTDYEWFVSAVPHAGQRSKDITSGAAIRRVPVDPQVQARAAAAGERAAPAVYAEAGLWYDAIAALSRLIERNPADTALRVQRAALLDQIGLQQASAFDRAARP